MSGNGRTPHGEWDELFEKAQAHLAQAEARELFRRAFQNWDDVAPERRVQIIREVRAADVLPDHISWFAMSWALEQLADGWAGDEFEASFADRFRALEERFGIDPDIALDDAPEEYRRLDEEYVEASDRIAADVFREYADPDMADAYLNNRAEFDRLREKGRKAVYGPMPTLEEIEALIADRDAKAEDDD